MEPHRIVSQDEWIAARKAHLADEKAFTRARDALSRKRRELPWVKVDKTYVFDGPNGKETLADLFGGKSQLIVYHFMLGPDWEAGRLSSRRARRCRRSKNSRRAWAGISNGCRRSATTSTSTITSPPRPRKRPAATRCTTTK